MTLCKGNHHTPHRADRPLALLVAKNLPVLRWSQAGAPHRKNELDANAAPANNPQRQGQAEHPTGGRQRSSADTNGRQRTSAGGDGRPRMNALTNQRARPSRPDGGAAATAGQASPRATPLETVKKLSTRSASRQLPDSLFRSASWCGRLALSILRLLGKTSVRLADVPKKAPTYVDRGMKNSDPVIETSRRPQSFVAIDRR